MSIVKSQFILMSSQSSGHVIRYLANPSGTLSTPTKVIWEVTFRVLIHNFLHFYIHLSYYNSIWLVSFNFASKNIGKELKAMDQ